MANTKKKSTTKKVDKKLDELLKDKKTIENTENLKAKDNKKKKSTSTKKTTSKKTTAKGATTKKAANSSVKKMTTKKTTTAKKTPSKKTTTKTKTKDKFIIVSDDIIDNNKETSESLKKLNDLSKEIRDLYEKAEEKKEPISIENVYITDNNNDDERIDKAYIILNRITIILFIIFMILLIAFIAFVIYICTY